MSPRSPIYSRGGGGRPVSCSRHRCPGVPPLGGISSDSTGFAVPSGDPQCSRGLSLPSLPAPQFRMVSQLGCISMFAASVAGDVRPVCHFRPSPLLHLFSPYRDPLSTGTDSLLQSWDGLLACAFPPWSVLPRVLASLGCLTGRSSPSSPSTGLSVLGSWTSSSCRWLLQCLFQHAQTSSSCLCLVTTTRVSTGRPFMPGDCPAPHQGGWFLLGGGCSTYQLKCRSQGHSISRPSLCRVADSLWWLRSVRALVFPPSRAIGRCSWRCSSSISLPSLATGFFGTCCVLFGSLLHPTRCVPLPGTS